ncbi:MAG TPA: DUF2892 domain-containing protein [Paracoccaceae bacterium]|nr:DUF2892 domain-containing protein [Paracoccaceae bacterium]
MSKNVGSIDRIVRVVLGLVLAGLFFYQPDAGYRWVALIVGLVLIGTAGMSFCPIYRILGMSTNK